MSKPTALALTALLLAAAIAGCAGDNSEVDDLAERVQALEADAAMSSATTTPKGDAPADVGEDDITPETTTTEATEADDDDRLEPPINTVSTGAGDTGDVSLHAATEQFTDWYPAGSAAIDEVAGAIAAVDSALEGRSRSALIDACYLLRDSAEAAGRLGPIPDIVAQRYWSEGLANLAAATDWCYGTADGDAEAAKNLRLEIDSGLTSLRAVATTLS